MERSRGSSSTTKLDRKTVEKNRRIRMHLLLQNLFSLVPSHNFQLTYKEGLPLIERVEQATRYLEQLREWVELLKEKKAEAEATSLGRGGGAGDENDSKLPVLKIMDIPGSGVQVIVVTRKGLQVSEVVRVLENEGAEVVGMKHRYHR